MEDHKKPSFIRVTPETRHKLKVLAAQRNQSMQQLIEHLVSQEIERSKKEESKNAHKDI